METAAFQIIRGGFSSMDMASIQASDGKSCYMLLLACWGLIADVDIESETMRKIGEARFTLGQCSVYHNCAIVVFIERSNLVL